MLVIISKRLPSREDLILVLSACVFLIHLWAYMAMFQAVPAWLMRMGLVDLSGTISYVLVFALFESLLTWSVLVFFASVFPATWLRKHFVSSGTTFLLVLNVWFITLNLYFTTFISQQTWNKTLIIIAAIASSFGFGYLAGRIKKIETIIRSILGYIVVLSSVYVLLDLAALLMIIVRNLIG